jgi:hypothetical protein
VTRRQSIQAGTHWVRDGSEAARRWAGISGSRLDTFKRFLVPIQAGTHWVLLDMDFFHVAVNVLDSLGLRKRKFQKISGKSSLKFPRGIANEQLRLCGVPTVVRKVHLREPSA